MTSELSELLAEVRKLTAISQRWLTVKEACAYAKMSRETLMQAVNLGEIRGRKRPIGGWIIDRESIDEYNAGFEGAAWDELKRRAL